MHRCLPIPFRLALVAASLALAGLPALAQQQAPAAPGAATRTFPAAALRGSVAFVAVNKAQLNGQEIRTAPGLRVFDAQNRLVMPHTLLGKTHTVHYVVERSTGMLHTVWLLSAAEAARPRAAPGMVVRNFSFESEQGNPAARR